MSIIFNEETLQKIENALGNELTKAFIKIWDERNAVKRYKKTTPLISDSELTPYWQYKQGEINGVLRNQTSWLYKIAADVRGVLTEEENVTLDKYLRDNDPFFGEELWEPFMEDRYP